MGTKKSHALWFVLGLGGSLQLVASLSITELICLIMAPVILVQDLDKVRRYGAMPFFGLTLMVVAGALFACLYNHTPGYFFIRGMAIACLLPCAVLVSVRMFDRDMDGFRWMILGAGISPILSIFVFQASVETHQLAGGATGLKAAEAIMSGPIFWISRVKSLVLAPMKGWYLQMPVGYSMLAPLFLAVFAMATSVSGRAVAVTSLMSAGFVIIGRKTRKKMRLISRYFVFFLIMGIVGLFAIKNFYAMAATRGWLGEKSRQKYESQTRGNKGMMALLIGGRLASFVGYAACLDNPIIGYGPFLEDKKDYMGQFLEKYGTDQDYADYILALQTEMRRGEQLVRFIPAHSSVVLFWLEFGIFGLIFWLYIFYVLVRYLRQDVAAVPQWYAWLACGIPMLLWDAFFSPFSARVGIPMFVVACLMARAVRQGKKRMPIEMIREIEKAERK